jgi:hypothetical protein
MSFRSGLSLAKVEAGIHGTALHLDSGLDAAHQVASVNSYSVAAAH